MRARVLVLIIAFAFAPAPATAAPGSSGSPYPDVTEQWSSPGAVWIARQLKQVNPYWRISASNLDSLADNWCSPNTRQAISALANAIPGADTRALPALSQLVETLRTSCYARGYYSPQTIDYWTYVTAEVLMGLVRANVIRQFQQARNAWQQRAPALPPTVETGIRSSVPLVCSAVDKLASSWIAKKALKGFWGWALLAGVSVAKSACSPTLNYAITRTLR